MSSQKSVASSGVVMALPPYLTMMVWPLREWMEEAMVMAFSTKDGMGAADSSVDAARDVEMSCCGRARVFGPEDENDDGTKPYVAVPRVDAVSMELMEKSFMVSDINMNMMNCEDERQVTIERVLCSRLYYLY